MVKFKGKNSLKNQIKEKRPTDLMGPAHLLLPVKRDWLRFVISPLRFQIQASCWSIQVSAVTEALYNIKNPRKKISLSPQWLLHRVIKPNAKSLAITNYNQVTRILRSEGICLERNCKFLGFLPKKYKPKAKNPFFIIEDAIERKSVDEHEVLLWLDQGPVLGVLPVSDELQNLRDGEVYEGSTAKPGDKHTLLIYGYETVKGVNVWKVRSSWGIGWSTKGCGYVIRQSSQAGSTRSLFESIWKPEVIVCTLHYYYLLLAFCVCNNKRVKCGRARKRIPKCNLTS
ncbi:uncharacterized protein LOC126661471 [Mercurialis annua]|uniref:uncharacterized protein LOC126661471 n=1 Tax=Mercurialis annua TaxID=3986 RepID=UPI0024AEB018|nr:uncharacterized protein LOC126661471 [Mercurialis annua]XP_055959992.1 uncharacterized protein LOC126661471 [Mercurialis annua]